jgi:hypothetical protein
MDSRRKIAGMTDRGGTAIDVLGTDLVTDLRAAVLSRYASSEDDCGMPAFALNQSRTGMLGACAALRTVFFFSDQG